MQNNAVGFHHASFTGKDGRSVLVAVEQVTSVHQVDDITWVICGGIHIPVALPAEEVISRIVAVAGQAHADWLNRS